MSINASIERIWEEALETAAAIRAESPRLADAHCILWLANERSGWNWRCKELIIGSPPASITLRFQALRSRMRRGYVAHVAPNGRMRSFARCV